MRWQLEPFQNHVLNRYAHFYSAGQEVTEQGFTVASQLSTNPALRDGLHTAKAAFNHRRRFLDAQLSLRCMKIS